MIERDDGGPAFPATSWTHDGEFRGANDGMSLRDYFAATIPVSEIAVIRVKEDREALAGRAEPVRADEGLDGVRYNFEVEAALRYMYADAMLKARKA